MSWTIGLMKNTVKISKACAKDLLKATKDEDVWYNLKEVTTEEGHMSFNPDFMEGMDIVCSDTIQKVLKKHKVSGEICFGSLEGDNEGEFWGYSFDGEGEMSTLKGTVVWKFR